MAIRKYILAGLVGIPLALCVGLFLATTDAGAGIVHRLVVMGKLVVGAQVPAGELTVVCRTASDDALVVRGHASQAGDLLDLQNSSGTTLAKFDKDGDLESVSILTGAGTFTGVITGSAGVAETKQLACDQADSYTDVIALDIDGSTASTADVANIGQAATEYLSVTHDGTVDIAIKLQLAGASPLVLEGATADDYETTVALADPTADRTITLPDYDGDIPLVVSQSAAQMSCVDGTSDVTGSSVTLADGFFTAGKTLKWTVAGTIAGGNVAKNVILYIDNAAIITLATEAATTGDYLAECWMHEHTDAAHQKAYCKMVVAAAADIEFDYAADTTDFNDGSPTTVKIQIVSGHASDTITTEHVIVEYFN